MRIVSLDELTEDMVLAKALYEDMDRILLHEGTFHLPRYKEKFQELGFRYLYVEDSISKGIEIEAVVSEQIRAQGRKMANELMHKVITDKTLDAHELKKWVEKTIHEICSNKTVMISLVELKSKDDYLYQHTINVTVLALVIGRTMGYEEKQLRHLGMGAILHDIGMLLLPESLRQNSYEALDAEERKIYRAHPQVGYELLNALGGVDTLCKTVVWRHHEQVNGLGYPCGVGEEKIPEFVKIISVCDAYDSLTILREGGRVAAPYQALEYLIGNVDTQFDKKIVMQFLKYIAPFPLGSMVVLSDGRKALVERQNEGFPARPVLRLVDGPAHASIDLMREMNLVIDRLA